MPQSSRRWDAVIIGSGPNGLTAAVSLARAGHSVLVLEASDEIGGGARTLPLTLPGFQHDVCSAIHPMAIASPAFRDMPLAQHGLDWIQPDAPLAHPLDGGRAVLLQRSVADTARSLGADAEAYYDLFAPAVDNWPLLEGKLRTPRKPARLLKLAVAGVRSAMAVSDAKFQTTAARALFGGLAGHSNLLLDASPSAGFGLAMGATAHAVGWPFPRGGSGMITKSLASYLRTMGAEIETSARVNSFDELPPCRTILCDLTPRELLRISGEWFPAWYRRKLEKYVYGPGAFKVDWALDGPIPWSAGECRRAGTLHIGGTLEEIATGERAVWSGQCPERPFVLAAQHTLFDPTRAPAGKHTGWGYCHVPNGSSEDMTDRIERQIERFAPGFRDHILARSVLPPAALEARNSNLVGGDFCGGANIWAQLITRPTLLTYRTPKSRVFICSAATPPGAGVHGLCGYMAARPALVHLRPARRMAFLSAAAVALLTAALLLRRTRASSRAGL